MSATRWRGWIVGVGTVAACLVACGGNAPPGAEAEPTEATEPTAHADSFAPATVTCLPPLCRPASKGFNAHYFNGLTQTNSASFEVAYYWKENIILHEEILSFAIWDDLPGLKGCDYGITVSTTAAPTRPLISTGGPLLCDGTTYYTEMNLDDNGLFFAIEGALGDTLANVCEATNGEGTEVTIPTFVEAWASGSSTPGAIVVRDPLSGSSTPSPFGTLNITLECPND